MRLVHGLMAACLVGAFFTAESERWRALHNTLGYGLLLLLLLRVFYARIGPLPARAQALVARLRAVLRGAPLGPPMVGLILSIGLLWGLMVLSVFSGWATEAEASWTEGWALSHGWISEAALIVALLHVAAVAGVSLHRRRNHASLMWHGRLEGRGPSVVRSDRKPIALALLGLWMLGLWGVWLWVVG